MTENKPYTNRNLADDYLKVHASYGNDAGSAIIEAILKTTTDIPGYYQENGNLVGLKVKGIDRKTEQTLELILQLGAEEINSLIIRAEQKKYEKPIKPKRAGLHDDPFEPSPWGENVSREMEDKS